MASCPLEDRVFYDIMTFANIFIVHVVFIPVDFISAGEHLWICSAAGVCFNAAFSCPDGNIWAFVWNKHIRKPMPDDIENLFSSVLYLRFALWSVVWKGLWSFSAYADSFFFFFLNPSSLSLSAFFLLCLFSSSYYLRKGDVFLHVFQTKCCSLQTVLGWWNNVWIGTQYCSLVPIMQRRVVVLHEEFTRLYQARCRLLFQVHARLNPLIWHSEKRCKKYLTWNHIPYWFCAKRR